MAKKDHTGEPAHIKDILELFDAAGLDYGERDKVVLSRSVNQITSKKGESDLYQVGMALYAAKLQKRSSDAMLLLSLVLTIATIISLSS